MTHITTLISRHIDLNEGLRHQQHLPHHLICGNDQAHAFRIVCTRDGEEADLTGAVCMGFVRRADGVTIPVEGSISGSMATIVLTAACYQAPGHTVISIDLVQDGVHATHAVWTAIVDSIQTERIGGEAAVSVLEAMQRAEAAADRAAVAGGASAWYVTVSGGAADKTLSQIVTAHQAGNIVLCRVGDDQSILQPVKIVADAEAVFSGFRGTQHIMAVIPAQGSAAVTRTDCITEHQDVSGKLDADALPAAINTALAQAKASGEFDGADGYTPVKGTDYFDGEKGDPGVSPTVNVSKSGKVTTIAITDAQGTQTASVSDGADGATPVKGTDYFTAADRSEMVAQVKSSLGYSAETWTFTLADGSTVTKKVVLGG